LPPCVTAGAALGGDLAPILAGFAGQLLVGFQWCALTADALALRPPPPAAHAAWRALLLAAAHADTLGLATGAV
jgi:hypothetical protein